MWIENATCHDTTSSAWNIKIPGSHTFQIQCKIKFVRNALGEWNVSHFGHGNSKIKTSKEKINNLQHASQSSENLSLEHHLQIELDE